MTTEQQLNLDNAWGSETSLPTLDLRAWGPRLRYCAPPREIEAFYREIGPKLTPFTLYGSGDFHYLSALFQSRIQQEYILISFDNHPDWDIRPPRFGCGAWINRALENPLLQSAAVWGCGNFECFWPCKIFANHAALRSERLRVHAWPNENGKSPDGSGIQPITAQNWRDQFSAFAQSLTSRAIYITIDLDCLRSSDAVTNWENGRFSLDDLAWALRELRARAKIIGGDLCGAWSPPAYARWTQKFCANWDHPKLPPPDPAKAAKKNNAVLAALWPELTGQA